MRLIRPAMALVVVAALAVSLGTPEASARSLVGSRCPTLGARMGDGPGRTVVCVKKGKRQVWALAPSGQQSAASCSKAPVFTKNLIDPTYVRVVAPIGGQTGSGGVIAVRSYIFPDSAYAGRQLPIYAPTDLTLNGASYYKPAGAAADYQPEYSLYFTTACGYKVQLFHIKGIVGRVASVAPTSATSSSASQGVPATKVAAGEQIGWYQLGDRSVAFDFWVDDPSRTNSFIDPSHFTDSNALHAVCPYQFYTPALAAVWLAKLGSAASSGPVPGTPCGTITQGKAGTADGMWFVSPTTKTDVLAFDGPYQSQIMLTTDPAGIVTIGGLNSSLSPALMRISPNTPTWTRPGDNTVGQSHCWSDDQQSVKVQLTSATTMAVLVAPGPCSALGDAASGRTYYR